MLTLACSPVLNARAQTGRDFVNALHHAIYTEANWLLNSFWQATAQGNCTCCFHLWRFLFMGCRKTSSDNLMVPSKKSQVYPQANWLGSQRNTSEQMAEPCNKIANTSRCNKIRLDGSHLRYDSQCLKAECIK